MRDGTGEGRDEVLCLGVALLSCLLGIWVRFALVGTTTLWGDEYHSLMAPREGLLAAAARFDATGSGIGFPLLQQLGIGLLGPTLWGARLPVFLAGAASLVLIYPVARAWVGPVGGALATLGLAVNPVHIYYSHFARGYAVVVLLCLALVFFVVRAQSGRRASWLAASACGALALYVHLASGAVVVAVFAVAALAGPARGSAPEGRRPFLDAALAGSAALLLAALLHLPALGSLVDFVQAKALKGDQRLPFGALDVASVFAGSRAGGLVAGAGVALSALLFLRTRHRAAPPVVGAALLAPAILLLVNPLSYAGAWARYLIPCLPFWLMLLGWGAARLARRLARPPDPRWRAATALALGALALVGSAWRPLRASALRADAPFSGTYLGLGGNEAFDAAFRPPGSRYPDPELLRGVDRVVEAPPVGFAGALLYRNYVLQNRRSTQLGYGDRPPLGISGSPLRALPDLTSSCDGRTTLVVLHRQLNEEVRLYRDAVAARLPADHPVLGALLLLPPREPRQGGTTPGALRSLLGPPDDASRWHWIWRVPCPAG